MELNKWYKYEEVNEYHTNRVCYFKPEYDDELMGVYKGTFIRSVEYDDGDSSLDISCHCYNIYTDEINNYKLADDLCTKEEISFIIEKYSEKII